MKISTALKEGIALLRWSVGLLVMLENILGVKVVSKLRAILLMEADFNATNKIVYGDRMLTNSRKYKLMPEEEFAEQNRIVDDDSLAKVVFYDIVRQLCIPAGIASVDAINCYDSIVHVIASLVFCSFDVADMTVKAMLEAIEEMKFFLQTAYGDSNNSTTCTLQVRTQGLFQGNRVTPGGFLAISIVILCCRKRKGHRAMLIAPISRMRAKTAEIMFVKDNDLLHINMERDESIDKAFASLQVSVGS